LRDLEEIRDYIALDSEEHAIAYVVALRSATAQLL
jgi:plasmid stabilization system protein ParE